MAGIVIHPQVIAKRPLLWHRHCGNANVCHLLGLSRKTHKDAMAAPWTLSVLDRGVIFGGEHLASSVKQHRVQEGVRGEDGDMEVK